MEEIKKLRNLPPRRAGDHKGNFGRVLIVAGSPGMCGAGCLAALGAQKAGAGLVTLALPEGSAPVGELFRASIISKELAAGAGGAISAKAAPEVLNMARTAADVCALGPGLGRDDGTAEAVRMLTRKLQIPLVLDADALNALAEDSAALKERTAPAVITPHPGEMARLAGEKTATAVQGDRTAIAATFALGHGAVTVLKGHGTVVTDGERMYVNGTGNPGMATGGMGDVLTGMIAALIGGGLDCFEAASLGVFIHGLAGDDAAAGLSMTSLSPEDVLDTLPAVFARLERLGDVFEPAAMVAAGS